MTNMNNKEDITSEDGDDDYESCEDDSGEDTEEDEVSESDTSNEANSDVQNETEDEDSDTSDLSSKSDEAEEEFIEIERSAVNSQETEAEECCPICMLPFGNQQVGTPDLCDHLFCLDCILEWSKNVNTCPLDRQVFQIVLARQSITDEVYKRIPVENQQLLMNEEPHEEEITLCEECGQGDREDRLLLCDGCNQGYHLECLDPPLSHVPRGDWFCPGCYRTRGQNLLEARESEANRSRTLRLRHTQPVARTIIADRVRSAVIRIRSTRRQAMISSESEAENVQAGNVIAGSSNGLRRKRRASSTGTGSVPKKRRKKRKTKTRKRKTVSVKSQTAGASSLSRKGEVRRRNRKTRKGKKKKKIRRNARTKRTVQTKTVKTRLASRLGIALPFAGQQLPRQVRPAHSESFLGSSRFDATPLPLSIWGNRNDLDPFVNSTGTDTDPINEQADGDCSQSERRLSVRQTKHCSDVLGGILQGQKLLHMTPQQIFIDKDGSLRPSVKEESCSVNTAMAMAASTVHHNNTSDARSCKDSVPSSLAKTADEMCSCVGARRYAQATDASFYSQTKGQTAVSCAKMHDTSAKGSSLLLEPIAFPFRLSSPTSIKKEVCSTLSEQQGAALDNKTKILIGHTHDVKCKYENESSYSPNSTFCFDGMKGYDYWEDCGKERPTEVKVKENSVLSSSLMSSTGPRKLHHKLKNSKLYTENDTEIRDNSKACDMHYLLHTQNCLQSEMPSSLSLDANTTVGKTCGKICGESCNSLTLVNDVGFNKNLDNTSAFLKEVSEHHASNEHSLVTSDYSVADDSRKHNYPNDFLSYRMLNVAHCLNIKPSVNFLFTNEVTQKEKRSMCLGLLPKLEPLSDSRNCSYALENNSGNSLHKNANSCSNFQTKEFLQNRNVTAKLLLESSLGRELPTNSSERIMFKSPLVTEMVQVPVLESSFKSVLDTSGSNERSQFSMKCPKFDRPSCTSSFDGLSVFPSEQTTENTSMLNSETINRMLPFDRHSAGDECFASLTMTGNVHKNTSCVTAEQGDNNKDLLVNKKTKQQKIEQLAIVEGRIKHILKPYFLRGQITKDEYKDIMRQTVPKIYQRQSKDHNSAKIQSYIEQCVVKATCKRNSAQI